MLVGMSGIGNDVAYLNGGHIFGVDATNPEHLTRCMMLGREIADDFRRLIQEQESKRPNFVVFITDDQQWDDVSCARNTILQTPAMDAIAREGLTFTNAFVTVSWCAPSRACFLTGKYPDVHGVHGSLQIHRILSGNSRRHDGTAI